MAVELATAYVSLIPSLRGLQARLDKEFGQPLTQAADKASRDARQSIERTVGGAQVDGGKVIGRDLAQAGAKAGKEARKGLDDALGTPSAGARSPLEGLIGPGALAAARASSRSLVETVEAELATVQGPPPSTLLGFTTEAAVQAAQQARVARQAADGELSKLGAGVDLRGRWREKIADPIVSAARDGAARARASIGSGLDFLSDNKANLARTGAGLTAFATAGALGLKTLADSASNYAETQSKANVVLGSDGAAALEKYAAQAVKTAGLSRTAALTAATTFSVFGKAAGKQGTELADFSTQLTQLAGDLASFGNTSTDQAIEAIGAGLRGESEPLRQYGVLLDDATLKSRAMAIGIYEGTGSLTAQQRVLAAQAEILAQTTDAQGDFIRTSDGFANQQRILAAEVENLKTELGQGLLPVAQSVVGGLSSVVGVVSQLPGPVKEGAGAVGALVVGLAGLGGGLSLIGSGLGTLNDLRKRLADTVQSGGGFVNTLKGINPAMVAATAAVGVGVGVFEAWYSASTEAAQGNQAFADSLLGIDADNPVKSTSAEIERLLGGTQRGTERFRQNWREAGLTIGEVAKSIALRGADFDRFRDSVDGAGGALETLSTRVGDVDDVDGTLGRIRSAAKDAGPEVEKLVGRLTDSYEAGEISGDVFRTNIDLLAEVSKGYKLSATDVGLYAKQLTDLTREQGISLTAEQKAAAARAQDKSLDFETRRQALLKLADAYPELAAQVSSVIAPTDGLTDATKELSDAQISAEDAAQLLDGSLGRLRTALDLNDVDASSFAAGVSAYADAINGSTTIDDAVSTAFGLADANKSFADSVKNLPKNLDPALIAFRGFSDEQSKAFDAALQARDAISGYLGVLAATGSYDQAIGAGNLLRLSYLGQLDAVGITGEAAQGYLQVLGLTPEQVDTAILLTGAEEAATKLQLYGQLLADEVPPEVKVEIATLISEGNVQGAAARYEEFLAELRAKPPVQIGVETNTRGATIALNDWARQNDGRKITVTVGLRAVAEGQADLLQNGLKGQLLLRGRADGGPQAAGEPGIVGERGPELWWPDAAGSIFNAAQASAIARTAQTPTVTRSQRPINLTTNVAGNVDERRLASEQVRQLRDEEWLEMAGGLG